MKITLHGIFPLLAIFLSAAAATIQAQNKCVNPFDSVKMPAKDAVIADIRQVVRGDAEKLGAYRDAETMFYDYAKCREGISLNEGGLYEKIKAAAEEELTRYLALAPDDAESKTILAQAELLNGNSFKADKLIDEAIALDNKNFEAYFVKGFINFKSTKGLQNVAVAIRINPDFAPAYALQTEILLNLAGKSSAQEQRDFYEQALKSTQRYLELAPDSPRAEFWRGQIDAIKFFLNSPETSFKSPAAGENLKSVYLKAKPRANYTDIARTANAQGVVRVRVWFGKDGKIASVLVLQSLPFGLTQQAVSVAGQITFEPALSDGQPVTTAKIVEYSFTLY